MDLKRIQRIQDIMKTNKGKLCRYCLDNSGLFDLNNEENRGLEIRDTILECIGIRVQVSDGLPTFLCWECEKTFFSYQRFRKKCLENYCLLQLAKPEHQNYREEKQEESEIIHHPPPKQLNNVSNSIEIAEDPTQGSIEAIELQSILPITNLTHDDYIIHELVAQELDDVTAKTAEEQQPPELVDYAADEEVVLIEIDQPEEPQAVAQSFLEVTASEATETENESTAPSVAVKEEKQKRKPKETLQATHICGFCNKKFDTQPILKKHIQQSHKVKRELKEIIPIPLVDGVYECSKCDMKFVDINKLQQHEKKAHKVLHVCEYCEKVFGDLCNYQRHKRIHTGEKPFKCPECSKEFSDNGNYNRHLRFHAGDLKYKCEFCMHGFISKWDLEKHLRVHSGERPFKCPAENCNKAFKSAVELRTHSRTHTGERPHACNICSKTFTAYGNLWRHKKKMHADEPEVKEKKRAAITNMKMEHATD